MVLFPFPLPPKQKKYPSCFLKYVWCRKRRKRGHEQSGRTGGGRYCHHIFGSGRFGGPQLLVVVKGHIDDGCFHVFCIFIRVKLLVASIDGLVVGSGRGSGNVPRVEVAG